MMPRLILSRANTMIVNALVNLIREKQRSPNELIKAMCVILL